MDQLAPKSLTDRWVQCSIDDITVPVEKIDPKSEPEKIIDYIDISSIDNIRNRVSGSKTYRLSDAPSRARQIVRAGDVLFSTVRPYLRNIAAVPSPYDRQIASTGFAVLRPAAGIDEKFLFYCCASSDFVNAVSGKQYGVSYPAVKNEQVREQVIHLPPTNEQRRIVAKIEELFSELDKGVENLTTAREQLKVYRQAVLKHAFEGKLTAQWRKDNKDKLETPDELLAHIKKEREAGYHQQLADWEVAIMDWGAKGEKGKKPTKPRKPLEADRPSPEHRRRMWNPTEGWQWLQIGDFAFVTKLAGFEYTKFVRYSDDGDLPVIKAENTGPNGYRVTEYSRVHSSSVAELTRSHLKGGELLMVFVGAGTGNVATVPTDQKFFLGPNIGMMRVQSDAINPRYIELFLRSPCGKDLALAAVKAVAQPSLSMATIRQIPCVVPSQVEQDEIVARIESNLSIIEQTESEITNQIVMASVLRQAILKKAFTGELVRQDPSDEPALILLKRIRDEKEASNKKTNRKAAA